MPLELKVGAGKSIPMGGALLASDPQRMAEATRTGAVSNQAVVYTSREGSGYVVDWQLPGPG